MKRSSGFRSSLLLALCLLAIVPDLDARETESEQLATRPYYTMFAASIERLQDVCEAVFDSVDRPDLASTMTERLKSYRNFAGIDRTKPLGIMSTWGSTSQADIIFLPVTGIDELLKTFTFEIVGYHQSGQDQYEIERPESPYHVLTKNGYAYFADALETIQALRITTEQLTRDLRNRYEFAIYLDLKQVPRAAKTSLVERLRTQIEPWLQEQDDETVETAKLRKTIGKIALDLAQRVILDTNTVTFGVHLDSETRLLSFEAIIDAAKGSSLELGLNRLVSHRSEFTSLISPDVPAGLAVNLPLGGLIQQILGPSGEKVTKGSRLEAGLQLVSTKSGHLSLITALRGSEASDLNRAIPHLIIKLEKSGNLTAVRENFSIHHGIVFHSLVPRELPTAITQLIGRDVEIIVGQGKQSIWIGMGPPDNLPDQMKDAIDLVDDSPTTQGTGPLVRARFQAKQLPELINSELLATGIDAEASRQAFAKGDDGFSLTIEPVASGLKLRIEAEEGFLRLIGRDWAKQIDSSKR